MLRKSVWMKAISVSSSILIVACMVLYYFQVYSETSFSGVTGQNTYISQNIWLISSTSTASAKPSNSSKEDRKMSQRKRRLNYICQLGAKHGEWSHTDIKRYRSEWVKNDNFVVAPGKKFLLCVLPKCSSTSWHKLVRDMRDPEATERPMGWQDRQKNNQVAQELSFEAGRVLLTEKDGVRAMAVRHPFGKLISGWNQKLTRNSQYANFLLEAYPHMQEYASNKDEKHAIAFNDFVEYLAKYGEDYANLDYHFLPMTDLCKPCLYPYNAIFKQETTDEDAKWVMEKLGVGHLPWVGKGPTYEKSNKQEANEIIRNYFQNVKKSTIRKLMEIYFYDFALFGYSFDPETLEASGFR